MKPCSQKQRYLDRRLDDKAAGRFEKHLERCPDCLSDVNTWRAIPKSYLDQTSVADSTAPSELEVRLFVQKARVLKNRKKQASPGKPVFAAAAAVIIASLALVFLLRPGASVGPEQPSSKPMMNVVFKDSQGSLSTTRAYPLDEPLEAPLDQTASITLGQDQITLEPRSRIRILRHGPENTRVQLEQGKVACAVSSKRAGTDFSVAAGSYLVRVIGTRFTVEKDGQDGISVKVDEGRVEVSDNKGSSWILLPGESLRHPSELSNTETESVEVDQQAPRPGNLGATKPPILAEPANETKDERANWRKWIISGRVDEARAGLKDHLDRNPNDINGWSLLADAHRKAGDWQSAVAAYGRVTELEPGLGSGRARFLAGVLLQDKLNKYEDAAELYEQYLTQIERRGQLWATVMVRLALCYNALGQKQRAIELLETVIHTAPQVPAFQRAATLLENLRATQKKRKVTAEPSDL